MIPKYVNLLWLILKENVSSNFPLVWISTSKQLTGFLTHLNKAHPIMKFTFKAFDNEIQYLDLSIHKNDNKCYIQPFFNETNTFSYVLGESSSSFCVQVHIR